MWRNRLWSQKIPETEKEICPLPITQVKLHRRQGSHVAFREEKYFSWKTRWASFFPNQSICSKHEWVLEHGQEKSNVFLSDRWAGGGGGNNMGLSRFISQSSPTRILNLLRCSFCVEQLCDKQMFLGNPVFLLTDPDTTKRIHFVSFNRIHHATSSDPCFCRYSNVPESFLQLRLVLSVR